MLISTIKNPNYFSKNIHFSRKLLSNPHSFKENRNRFTFSNQRRLLLISKNILNILTSQVNDKTERDFGMAFTEELCSQHRCTFQFPLLFFLCFLRSWLNKTTSVEQNVNTMHTYIFEPAAGASRYKLWLKLILGYLQQLN